MILSDCSLQCWLLLWPFVDHLAWWLECSPMVRETWVQSQVESYQWLKKWYLMPPCLTLSIIRYGLRVKWSNPSPTPSCSSYWKGSLWVALDCGCQLYFIGLNLLQKTCVCVWGGSWLVEKKYFFKLWIYFYISTRWMHSDNIQLMLPFFSSEMFACCVFIYLFIHFAGKWFWNVFVNQKRFQYLTI